MFEYMRVSIFSGTSAPPARAARRFTGNGQLHTRQIAREERFRLHADGGIVRAGAHAVGLRDTPRTDRRPRLSAGGSAFCFVPPPVMICTTLMLPYGQSVAQLPQPIHQSSMTMSSVSLRRIEPTGQRVMHSGSMQARQLVGDQVIVEAQPVANQAGDAIVVSSDAGLHALVAARALVEIQSSRFCPCINSCSRKSSSDTCWTRPSSFSIHLPARARYFCDGLRPRREMSRSIRAKSSALMRTSWTKSMAVQVAVRRPDCNGSSIISKVVLPIRKLSPGDISTVSTGCIRNVMGFLPPGRRVTRTCLPSAANWRCSREIYSSQGYVQRWGLPWSSCRKINGWRRRRLRRSRQACLPFARTRNTGGSSPISPK